MDAHRPLVWRLRKDVGCSLTLKETHCARRRWRRNGGERAISPMAPGRRTRPVILLVEAPPVGVGRGQLWVFLGRPRSASQVHRDPAKRRGIERRCRSEWLRARSPAKVPGIRGRILGSSAACGHLAKASRLIENPQSRCAQGNDILAVVARRAHRRISVNKLLSVPESVKIWIEVPAVRLHTVNARNHQFSLST